VISGAFVSWAATSIVPAKSSFRYGTARQWRRRRVVESAEAGSQRPMSERMIGESREDATAAQSPS